MQYIYKDLRVITNHNGTTHSVSSSSAPTTSTTTTTTTTVPSDTVNEYIHAKIYMFENIWHNVM